MVREIKSPFKRAFISKVFDFVHAYKQEDFNLKTFIKETLLKTNPEFKYYGEEGRDAIWLASVPEKIYKKDSEGNDISLNDREAEHEYVDVVIYYFCYLSSVFLLDEYFRNSEALNNWLPFYNSKGQITFAEKMLDVFNYKHFRNHHYDFSSIFELMTSLGNLLADNEDVSNDPTTISIMTKAIVNRAEVISSVAPIDLLTLTPVKPEE